MLGCAYVAFLFDLKHWEIERRGAETTRRVLQVEPPVEFLPARCVLAVHVWVLANHPFSP